MTSARITSKMKAALNEQLLTTYQDVQNELGVQSIQDELTQTSKHADNQDRLPFFNRFHSWLRFTNPTTSSNSYRTAVIGPCINFIGRVFNFANDKDCNLVAELFTTREQNRSARTTKLLLSQSQTWIAIFKMVLSMPGATIRQIATLADFCVDGIFSPVRFLTNVHAAFADPNEFLETLLRQYQAIAPQTKPQTSIDISSDITINTITLNTGLLRNLYWGNKEYFNDTRRPRIRAYEIANDLIERARDCDVICLQEVFDNWANFGFGKDAEHILIEALRQEFPYIVYDVGHRSWPFANSGLMVLSRHPILEVDYQRFPNLKEVEIFSNKGFIGVKIEKGNRFFTLYNVHAQSPLYTLSTDWMERLSKKGVPDTLKKCRGKQLAYVHEHMRRWAKQPVKAAPELQYGDTLVMGDSNLNLYDHHKIYAISSGKKNVNTRGTVKQPGQNGLMRDLSPHLPDNFIPRTLIKQEDTEQKLVLAKRRLMSKLRVTPAFATLTDDELQTQVDNSFVMMSGSWVRCELGDTDQNLHFRRPMYDICFSADFDKPGQLASRGLQAGERRCLLFYPKVPDKEYYSDHSGIQTQLTYRKM